VQVALVHRQPALDLLRLDPDRLDAEAAGKRARDPLADDLRRYLDFSSAVPS
jgi:hypothetical protein